MPDSTPSSSRNVITCKPLANETGHHMLIRVNSDDIVDKSGADGPDSKPLESILYAEMDTERNSNMGSCARFPFRSMFSISLMQLVFSSGASGLTYCFRDCFLPTIDFGAWKWRELAGECCLVSDFLLKKPNNSLLWLPLKVLDAVLRGFSQVVFANSTVSGTCVVIGLGIGHFEMLCGGLLAAFSATVTAIVFDQDWSKISQGLMTYNGVLVGTLAIVISPGILDGTANPTYLHWCLIPIGGAFSALLTSAMMNLCQVASLPPMTLPFNVINTLLFACLQSPPLHLDATGNNFTTLPAELLDNQPYELDIINWDKVVFGGVIGMSQVYGVPSLACSLIMYAGIAVCSPFLAVSLFAGSSLGSFFGVPMAHTYGDVYNGLWGYNTALCAGAIVATFQKLSLHSTATTIFSVGFAVVFQRAIAQLLRKAGLPILTIPFVVTTSLVLSVSSRGTLCSIFKRNPEAVNFMDRKSPSIDSLTV